MFTSGSSSRNDVNDVANDAEGAPARGPIWVHKRADMGSRERDVIGLESRSVSAQVTKHFVTIY